MTTNALLDQGSVRRLTKDEIAHYQTHGWAKLENLISPELVSHLLESAKGLIGESGSETQMREGVDFISNWWHDRHFMARDQIEPFATLSYSEPMALNAQALMGRDVGVRHFNDLVACKGPAALGHKRTSWHQDYPDSPFDRVGALGFWIALNDVPPERGSLRFYSGSHKLGPLGVPSPAPQPGRQRDLFQTHPSIERDCALSEPLHLKAGDATCHHMFTIHSAPENQTETPRWAYITTYFPADTLYTGAMIHGHNDDALQKGKTFDHPYYPAVISA